MKYHIWDCLSGSHPSHYLSKYSCTCYFFHTECLKLLENGSKNVESSPIFRTGSGKPVGIKESSIEKALFVLGSEDVSNSGNRPTVLC